MRAVFARPHTLPFGLSAVARQLFCCCSALDLHEVAEPERGARYW